MKWSVSNIEIDLTAPPCVEVWAGWSAPSVGSVNLGGDPQYDLIDGVSGVTYERAITTNGSVGGLFVDNMCGGLLAIINVTGLQAGMDKLRLASDQEFDDPDISGDYVHLGQIIANVGSSIEIIVNMRADYTFDGITWTAGEVGQTVIVYNGVPTTHSVLWQNFSAFGETPMIDPGLVWMRVSPEGDVTYSHTPDGTQPFDSFGRDFSFFAAGTETTSTIGLEAVYAFATADFFSTAGIFFGDWTVAEALALL